MYFAYNSANTQCITTLTTGVMFIKHLPHSCVSLNVIRKMQTNLDGIFKDLPDGFIHSTTRLFSDDCVLYRPIKIHDDTTLLQIDLNPIAQWECRWQIKFNIDKCTTLRVGRARQYFIFTYTLQSIINLYRQQTQLNTLPSH